MAAISPGQHVALVEKSTIMGRWLLKTEDAVSRDACLQGSRCQNGFGLLLGGARRAALLKAQCGRIPVKKLIDAGGHNCLAETLHGLNLL